MNISISSSESLIDAKALDRVTQAVENATGLPNPFYNDAGLFEIEKQAVFAKNWACLGFASDVPEVGSAKPIDFLGQPLVMIRDKDEGVNVFENTCRHRGMIIVNEAKKTKGILRCPYHSWCYDSKGKLRTTPHVGGAGHNTHEGIKKDELSLNQIRSHEWLGLIFINLDGQAEPFETQHATLLEQWAEFNNRPLYFGGEDSQFTLKVNCNWKLAVENYCESYHLPWIHPGLNSYSRLEDHYNIVEQHQYSGQGTVVYNPTLNDNGLTFPNFDGLSDKWDTGAEYISLFPNVLLGVHRDHTFAIVLEPVTHDQTLEHVAILYTSPDAQGEKFANLRQQNTAMWREIFEEDVFVVEGMQKGRNAANFDGGKFSPIMDPPTHCFHEWVANQFKNHLDK